MTRYKVLHIITRLVIGGAQENTMLTADLLDKSRWQVDVLSGPQTGPEGSLIEEVRQRGVPLTIEPSLVREINPLKDALALWKLRQFIKRGQYDIVHTHSSKAGILGRWAARQAGTPLIVHTVHGWGHNERQPAWLRQLYIRLEQQVLPFTDRLIAVSPRDIEKGVQDGIGRTGDYTVIRSGIELDRFGHPQVPREQIRAELGIPAKALVIGAVTRFSEQKAPLDFVEAAARVAARTENVYFVMVGDGPLRSQVEQRQTELGLTERLILTGLRRDIPELMAAFDQLALSSLWEGLPRVIPQAMATGLPVVATAVDGNAEAVENNITGKLVPPADPEALAAAMYELITQVQRSQLMGKQARRRVEDFSATKMVADIAAEYEALIARKNIRPA